MAQGGPEIDKPKTVKTQAYHCRPPRRGHTNQFCGVGGPGKMRCPALLTGMKQQHVTLGGRVSPCDKGFFEAIAAETGQSKVRRVGRAASCFRNDMLDRKRIGGKAGEAAAILTLP